MRRAFFTLLASLLAIVGLPSIANAANSIDSIDINVEIQSDGSAIFTDHRIFTANEGTEHYLRYDNLDTSQITDFSVSEQGTPLRDVGAWDVDRSLEEKAGTYGIVRDGSAIELCFGIGEYGTRDFTLTYRVTDFVRNLNDGNQAFYWYFTNPDMDPIDQLNITVRPAPGLSWDDTNARMWGFGTDGTTSISANEITMSASNLGSSDYSVILAIFDSGVLTGSGSYDEDSASIEEEAKQGSVWEGESSSSGGSSWDGGSDDGFFGFRNAPGFFGGFSFFPFLFMFAFIFVLRRLLRGASADSPRNSTLTGFSPTTGVNYNRNIPEHDFFAIAGLIKTSPSNWMAAQFLRWVKADLMRPMTYEEGLIFKRDAEGLALNPQAHLGSMTSLEAQLWKQVTVAAGSNGLLERSEASSYYRRNPSSYKNWTDAVREHSAAYLIQRGFVTTSTTKFFKMTRYHITPAGQAVVDHVEGLKKFLKDFSIINEREPINVHLWDDYLIWAAFLGIADEVHEQFNLIDPTYATTSGMTTSTIHAATHVSSSASSGYQSGTSGSSSSGGGGFSSSGGGGGGSGGSSGGGTR